MGEGQREGDPESKPGSRLRAVSTEPHTGFELMNREITTWAEVGRLTDSPAQAPQDISIFINFTDTDVLFVCENEMRGMGDWIWSGSQNTWER